MELQFIVPGEPRGKGRPRFTRRGFAYTDTATRDYETLIACRASEAMPCAPVETPVSVRVDMKPDEFAAFREWKAQYAPPPRPPVVEKPKEAEPEFEKYAY